MKLGVTQDELLKLLETDRISLLLPAKITDYPGDLVGRIAAEFPHRLLLSRQLALASIAAIHSRAPLLLGAADLGDRRRLLQAIAEARDASADDATKRILKGTFNGLQLAWRHSIRGVPLRGAPGVAMAERLSPPPSQEKR